ncbi:hypothetical protein [Streptomyces gilvosporeus]|uniref:Uncharacterized protein n=1 Tax=Streptomyces gilvosporeus TaxID=553510 RepID=A0A1V0TMH5_9ACTN|nr:hypothetical protein [Streptomyces gilvosporeus]ARF53988.1 hypothetical protein B1H19_07130 [Streptomyces gilvosporeus]
MRKLRKAAVVVTVLGSVGLLGAGTAYAGGGTSDYRTQSVHEGYQQQSSGGRHGKSHARKTYIRQSTSCRTFEKNTDILGEIGSDDPLWILTHGLRARPGVQKTRLGSSEGCNNIIRL